MYLQVKSVKGDCVVRGTNDETVRPEILRPATVPAVMTKAPSHPHSRHQSVDPTVERRQSSAPNPNRQSRKTSAARSTTASSARTYSFKDFKLYAEEWEKDKLVPRKDLDASKIITADESAAPVIVIHDAAGEGQTSAEDCERQVKSAATHHSSQSSLEIGKSRRDIESKLQRVKQFAERRRLSAYAKKRLIDSAVTRQRRSAVISAC